MIGGGWWVVVVLGVLVGVALALDEWLAPEEPSARARRAWYAKRLAHRRGEQPDEAQMSRWLEEDR